MRLFTRVAVAAVVAGTTWDSGNSSTDWTLSNGNLTANRTSTGAGFWALLRGSASKTSGTIVVTVDAIGGGVGTGIGFDTGVETANLGGDNGGHSIGYSAGGSIIVAGATVATVATYTTSDIITCVKSGATFTFKKNGTVVFGPTDINVLTGSSQPVAGSAYPAASNGNGTGTQLTIDGSGW